MGLVHNFKFDLMVFHQAKESSVPLRSLPFPEDWLSIDTCLRKVWIGSRASSIPDSNSVGTQFFYDHDAYEFLLRLCCGLESSIQGETDIFGQVKESWSHYQSHHSQNSMALHHWIQKLFHQTKEIRRLYLQGLGGSSYGSLARRLLRPDENDLILIVGAGQLAQSVAPFFLNQKLRITNRDLQKAQNWSRQIEAPDLDILCARNRIEESEMLSKASTLIFCIPPTSHDDFYLEALGDGCQKVLHLGCRDSESAPWQQVLKQKSVKYYSLDDLFRLKESQSLRRSLQIARAEKACRDLALQQFSLEACPLLKAI